MMMKKILLFVFMTAIVTYFTSCSNEENKIKPLRVGMELQYPPFEMTDAKGKPAGISVDLANKFGEYLGRPVEIKPISWTGLIPSVRTGKIDVIISSMSPTLERAKAVDFSTPYVINGLALLVKADSKIAKFDDITNKMTVVVKTGTIGDVYVHKHLPENTIRQFDSVNACVMEIAQGRADAFIYDPLTLYQNYLKHPKTTKVILDRVPGTTNYSAMAFKKGNTELLESANKFIKETAKTDFFDELGNKYLGDIKKMYKEKGLPFFFDIETKEK